MAVKLLFSASAYWADQPRAAIGSTQESVLPQPANGPLNSIADAKAIARRSTGVLAIQARLSGRPAAVG